MKVAAVQFNSTGDVAANQVLVARLIREAAAGGAQLIVFPEAAAQNFASGRLDTQAQELDGSFASSLRELAQDLGVTVVAGMFRPADRVERAGKVFNRVYNTALVTGPGVHAGYDKLHTYDAFGYRESDTVKPGQELLIVEVAGMKVGIATCYDVRFPALFQDLARAGAQLIALPFSWADGPGKREQWRVLSVARALDSTAYIVAAGQSRPGGAAAAGTPAAGTPAGAPAAPTGIGHSVIVSPLGQRLAEAGYHDTIIYAEVDAAAVAQAREQLPVLGDSDYFQARPVAHA